MIIRNNNSSEAISNTAKNTEEFRGSKEFVANCAIE